MHMNHDIGTLPIRINNSKTLYMYLNEQHVHVHVHVVASTAVLTTTVIKVVNELSLL